MNTERNNNKSGLAGTQIYLNWVIIFIHTLSMLIYQGRISILHQYDDHASLIVFYTCFTKIIPESEQWAMHLFNSCQQCCIELVGGFILRIMKLHFWRLPTFILQVICANICTCPGSLFLEYLYLFLMIAGDIVVHWDLHPAASIHVTTDTIVNVHLH